METQEIWKGIYGYEGTYEISNLGNVRSLDRYIIHPVQGRKLIKSRYLRVTINNCGYCKVFLNINGKNKSNYIHRLVALTFIPNTENKRCVNHKDGNKLNNKIDNLEWNTYSENLQHSFDNNIRVSIKNEDHYLSKYIIDVSTGVFYYSIKEASEFNNIKQSSLSACLNGRCKNKTSLRYA